MLTDLLLAVVTGALALRVMGDHSQDDPGWITAWGLTFGFTSAAALIGGLFHGLRHHVRQSLSAWLWRVTVILSAGVGFCLMLVAAQVTVAPALQAFLQLLGAAKLLLVLYLARRSWTFTAVAVDSGMSLLVLGGVAAWGMSAGEMDPRGWWIVGGVILSLAGAAVQQSRVWSDRPFDHNDLFHVVQIVASILFFQGVGRG